MLWLGNERQVSARHFWKRLNDFELNPELTVLMVTLAQRNPALSLKTGLILADLELIAFARCDAGAVCTRVDQEITSGLIADSAMAARGFIVRDHNVAVRSPANSDLSLRAVEPGRYASKA